MATSHQDTPPADAHQLSVGSSEEETMDSHDVRDATIPEEDDESISSPWIGSHPPGKPPLASAATPLSDSPRPSATQVAFPPRLRASSA
ncbi:hypothetical protein MTO96_050099 [Rhipicephalus appendiculatus]